MKRVQGCVQMGFDIINLRVRDFADKVKPLVEKALRDSRVVGPLEVVMDQKQILDLKGKPARVEIELGDLKLTNKAEQNLIQEILLNSPQGRAEVIFLGQPPKHNTQQKSALVKA